MGVNYDNLLAHVEENVAAPLTSFSYLSLCRLGNVRIVVTVPLSFLEVINITNVMAYSEKKAMLVLYLFSRT